MARRSTSRQGIANPVAADRSLSLMLNISAKWTWAPFCNLLEKVTAAGVVTPAWVAARRLAMSLVRV